MSTTRRQESAAAQLTRFLSKYTPEVRNVAEQSLAKLRTRLPGAIEIVYDNYNALAIGFGPSERASEAIFSIVLYPRWVSLFFLHGAVLPDPQKLLRGEGKVVRHIVLADADVLDQPAVRELMKQALKRLEAPFDGTAPSRLIIKSISAKQRARRPSR